MRNLLIFVDNSLFFLTIFLQYFYKQARYSSHRCKFQTYMVGWPYWEPACNSTKKWTLSQVGCEYFAKIFIYKINFQQNFRKTSVKFIFSKTAGLEVWQNWTPVHMLLKNSTKIFNHKTSSKSLREGSKSLLRCSF